MSKKWYLEKQRRQVPYNDFVDIVRSVGIVMAGLSHDNPQQHIDSAAILHWQWDGDKGVLFSITKLNKRVECSKNMPGFYLYDIEYMPKVR